MKQLFAYLILFCLVFLNVPRSLVHDCDHDHHDHVENESGISFEQDDCFACEFDLDFFEVPSLSYAKVQKVQFPVEDSSVNNLDYTTEFASFSHRGPPVG